MLWIDMTKKFIEDPLNHTTNQSVARVNNAQEQKDAVVKENPAGVRFLSRLTRNNFPTKGEHDCDTEIEARKVQSIDQANQVVPNSSDSCHQRNAYVSFFSSLSWKHS